MALGRSVLSLSLTQRLLNNKSINFRDQQALQLPSTPTPSLSSVIKGSEKSCMVLHSSILNNLGRNEGLRDFILTVSSLRSSCWTPVLQKRKCLCDQVFQNSFSQAKLASLYCWDGDFSSVWIYNITWEMLIFTTKNIHLYIPSCIAFGTAFCNLLCSLKMDLEQRKPKPGLKRVGTDFPKESLDQLWPFLCSITVSFYSEGFFFFLTCKLIKQTSTLSLR